MGNAQRQDDGGQIEQTLSTVQEQGGQQGQEQKRQREALEGQGTSVNSMDSMNLIIENSADQLSATASSGSGLLAASPSHDVKADVLALSSPGPVTSPINSTAGREDSARLRSELREARDTTAGLRRELAAVRKA